MQVVYLGRPSICSPYLLGTALTKAVLFDLLTLMNLVKNCFFYLAIKYIATSSWFSLETAENSHFKQYLRNIL